jgi:hypothetical protein
MASIKKSAWFGGHEVRVNQKYLSFRYLKPSPKDIKHAGKTLTISAFDPHSETVIKLKGTQINTLKKILKVAGEI